MAVVTGLTAARMKAIEAASIVKGAVVGNNLILEKFDASKIDAGNVRGPVGPVGPAGDVSNAGMRRGLFSAYRATTLSIPQGITTAIAMDAEEFDLSGWHGSGGFNPKLAGYYRLNIGMAINTTVGNGTRFIISIFKNGGLYKNLRINYPAGGANNLVAATVIMEANGTTDYFQPGLRHEHTAPIDIGPGLSSGTHFQGELIAPIA